MQNMVTLTQVHTKKKFQEKILQQAWKAISPN